MSFFEQALLPAIEGAVAIVVIDGVVHHWTHDQIREYKRKHPNKKVKVVGHVKKGQKWHSTKKGKHYKR
jgi:hypothetical protein